MGDATTEVAVTSAVTAAAGVTITIHNSWGYFLLLTINCSLVSNYLCALGTCATFTFLITSSITFPRSCITHNNFLTLLGS